MCAGLPGAAAEATRGRNRFGGTSVPKWQQQQQHSNPVGRLPDISKHSGRGVHPKPAGPTLNRELLVSISSSVYWPKCQVTAVPGIEWQAVEGGGRQKDQGVYCPLPAACLGWSLSDLLPPEGSKPAHTFPLQAEQEGLPAPSTLPPGLKGNEWEKQKEAGSHPCRGKAEWWEGTVVAAAVQTPAGSAPDLLAPAGPNAACPHPPMPLPDPGQDGRGEERRVAGSDAQAHHSPYVHPPLQPPPLSNPVRATAEANQAPLAGLLPEAPASIGPR